MRFPTKNLIPIFAVGILILAQGFSFIKPALASVQKPQPSFPYTISGKVIKDIFNSPQMAPLADWKMIMLTGVRGISDDQQVNLGLAYLLPIDFSRYNIQYFLVASVLDVSLDARQGSDHLNLSDIYSKALEVKNVIKKLENDNRLKEFSGHVGVEEALINLIDGEVSYINRSSGDYMEYNIPYKQEPELERYVVPMNESWQNFPEIDRLKSIFQREPVVRSCVVAPIDGRVDGHRPQAALNVRAGWLFNSLDVQGSECFSKQVDAHLYDNGEQSVSLSNFFGVTFSRPQLSKSKSPATISALLVEQKRLDYVEDIKLDGKNYNVTGHRTIRLFWLIPIRLGVKLSVDATTGNVM